MLHASPCTQPTLRCARERIQTRWWRLADGQYTGLTCNALRNSTVGATPLRARWTPAPTRQSPLCLAASNKEAGSQLVPRCRQPSALTTQDLCCSPASPKNIYIHYLIIRERYFLNYISKCAPPDREHFDICFIQVLDRFQTFRSNQTFGVRRVLARREETSPRPRFSQTTSKQRTRTFQAKLTIDPILGVTRGKSMKHCGRYRI